MVTKRVFNSFMLFGIVCAQVDEPHCSSRFDYEFKVVQKLSEFQDQQLKIEDTIDRQKEEILELRSRNRELAKRLDDFEHLHNNHHGGDTYVRWGRTTCPGNGTELVYKGYAGGSYFSNTGGSVNYLCLPDEPLWGVYDDTLRSDSALVYGAEYQLNGRSGKPFFNEEMQEHDSPCAVCKTSRTSAVMIPARNACYGGWTMEYKGYLTAGHYTHPASSEFVCVDESPEILEKEHKNENGILFSFSEARCGSLKCPPYVEGRELTCVVCSK